MLPSTEKPKSRLGTVFVLALLALVGVGLFWYLEKSPPGSEAEPVLTAEAKAYTRNLKLSEVEMKATENALRQTLVEITGSITNNGESPVGLVELNCVFYDVAPQVILRQRVQIVRSRDGALQPGETRRFRLPFDNIPDTWNQTMPQLVIAQIQFE